MDFGIRGEVVGLAEVVQTLKELPDKLQRKVLRKALSKATKPTLMAAKRNARAIKDTGAYAKSMARKVVTYKASGVLVVVIGPRSGQTLYLYRRGRKTATPVNPAYYAHLIEFGTRPHRLEGGQRAPKGRHPEKLAAINVAIRMHPGSQAHPVLRSAWDETKGQILPILAEEVEDGLAKELAKGK